MSRLWLLSLLCLSVLFLSLVQLTRARGEFKVNETTTKILFDKPLAEVLLSVENSTGETLNAQVEVEILDPRNNSSAKTTQFQSIAQGSRNVSFSLPLTYSNLDEKQRRNLLWYRLRYRLSENGSTTYEGETDANSVFVAQINLASDQESRAVVAPSTFRVK